jgi:hypothetical protein
VQEVVLCGWRGSGWGSLLGKGEWRRGTRAFRRLAQSRYHGYSIKLTQVEQEGLIHSFHSYLRSDVSSNSPYICCSPALRMLGVGKYDMIQAHAGKGIGLCRSV